MTNREAIEIADKAMQEKLLDWRAKNSAVTPLPYNIIYASRVLEAMKQAFKDKLDFPYDKGCQIIIKI